MSGPCRKGVPAGSEMISSLKCCMLTQKYEQTLQARQLLLQEQSDMTVCQALTCTWNSVATRPVSAFIYNSALSLVCVSVICLTSTTIMLFPCCCFLLLSTLLLSFLFSSTKSHFVTLSLTLPSSSHIILSCSVSVKNRESCSHLDGS